MILLSCKVISVVDTNENPTLLVCASYSDYRSIVTPCAICSCNDVKNDIYQGNRTVSRQGNEVQRVMRGNTMSATFHTSVWFVPVLHDASFALVAPEKLSLLNESLLCNVVNMVTIRKLTELFSNFYLFQHLRQQERCG